MKCSQPTNNVLCTGHPGETEERLGQESNHSPQNLQAHDEEGGRNSIADVPEETRHHRESEHKTTCSLHLPHAQKEPVNLPPAAAKKEWEMFDHNMDQVLEAAIAGDVGKNLRAMSSINWSLGD